MMSPEMLKFLGLSLAVVYPFHVLKQRKAAKALRNPLWVDYADCGFTRMLWQTESRVNGEDHAAKLFPPQRLTQIIYAEAIDSFGLKADMVKELKGVSLKKLEFLRALYVVCVDADDKAAEVVFAAYPNHSSAFMKLRESRRRFFRDMAMNEARITEKDNKQKQAVANRIDLSQQLRDKDDLLNWLIQHGPDPDFWHILVCNTDPDGRAEIYHWIVSQPACDAGTAAQIFHHSRAYEALTYQAQAFPEHLETLYATAKLAADRWFAGNFQTHRFAPNDIYSSASHEEFKGLVAHAVEKFGAPTFQLSDGLFEDTPREAPKTNLYFTDF